MESRDFVMPAAEAFASGCIAYSAVRHDGRPVRESLELVEEVPVALSYNGVPHVVLLATPTDLEDLGVGFTCTEGIARRAGDIESVDVVPSRQGVALMLQIPWPDAERLGASRRFTTGHGGCGLCGVENLEAAMPTPARVTRRLSLEPEAIHRAMRELPAHQRLGARTGAAHAAAFADQGGAIVAVREDAGRHNALDKLIGHLARSGIDAASGFLVMSSRASSELALKASAAGFELMATVSAPTGLAVRIANEAGMTLIGFARENRFTCYAGLERIRDPVR